MPTVNVDRNLLFAAIGRTFTDQEFWDLCLKFGVELDEVTSPYEICRKDKGEAAAAGLSKDVTYKIDVPANRYDILCLEGIAGAMRVYLGIESAPKWQVAVPDAKDMITIHQKPETLGVRQFVVAAVLRNITFNQARYQSFMDLQEMLHKNVCRRRTLVAVGTHDLDTIQGPFTYEALPRKDIKFRALSQEKEMTADELFEVYQVGHLKDFLPITRDSPVHPVIYDSQRRVLSLPPIINGEHSKITLNTRNVLIECTATDLTRANIVLNTMIAMFSGYCDKPNSCESVKVVRPDGQETVFPDMSSHICEAPVDYINRILGINISGNEMISSLERMGLHTVMDEKNVLQVSVPCTRSDILHACDVAEDVGIAYGYDSIKRTMPHTTTVGGAFPLNHFADQIRASLAEAGYTEVLTWVLSCKEESITHLLRPASEYDDLAVVIDKPNMQEFSMVRMSLIPGLLKTLNSNKGIKGIHLPVRIFEVGDVVLKDKEHRVGARNFRKAAALYCGHTSGLEEIHGLADRLMTLNNCRFAGDVPASEAAAGAKRGRVYQYKPSENPSFFPGRRADIVVDGVVVGVMGIVHPQVLTDFGAAMGVCSLLELDLEVFL